MRRAACVAVALSALCLSPVTPRPAAVRAASPGYTMTSSTITVHGLGHAGDATHDCTIEYDLYKPDPLPAAHSVPAILTTNGFGGSKADGAAMARALVPRGYVVLSYSGLGFGNSTCTIEIDDPDWDGRAAAQIIDFLATVPEVRLDGPGDPRVGMWGGSYGGAIQLATASVTSKLDTIIPEITWNDLAYSLTPNNDSRSLLWTDRVAGVDKLAWAGLFFALGVSEPIQHPSTGTAAPSTVAGCPGYDPAICPSEITSIGTGAPSPSTIALLRHASMVSYGSRVRIPTMLMQGQGDTLFDIDEAVANRNLIMSNGADVKLVLQSWGHSFNGYPLDNTDFADPAKPTYDEQLIENWFDHYLQGSSVSTGPAVEYFRDWVTYDATASARPAYASAPSWPPAPDQALALSGTSDLVPTAATTTAALRPRAATAVASGSQTFASVPVPTSYTEVSAAQSTSPVSGLSATDAPGTFASWTSGPVTGNVDVAGIPSLRMNLTATPGVTLGSTAPGTDPVIFGKLFDVDPSGTATLLFPRFVAPIRVEDLSGPVTMTLPGVVHRFAAGHSIRLTLAASDAVYLNSRVPQVYTVSTSAASPSVLTLPVLTQSPGATGTIPTTVGSTSTTGLANTAAPRSPAALPVALAGVLGLVLVAGRRRRGL